MNSGLLLPPPPEELGAGAGADVGEGAGGSELDGEGAGGAEEVGAGAGAGEEEGVGAGAGSDDDDGAGAGVSEVEGTGAGSADGVGAATDEENDGGFAPTLLAAEEGCRSMDDVMTTLELEGVALALLLTSVLVGLFVLQRLTRRFRGTTVVATTGTVGTSGTASLATAVCRRWCTLRATCGVLRAEADTAMATRRNDLVKYMAARILLTE